MALVRLAPLAFVIPALAACGSDGGGGKTTAADELARGKKVFVASCGSCHSLRAAGTRGVVGGSLDGLSLGEKGVADVVRTGGGGMPAFETALTPAQCQGSLEFPRPAHRNSPPSACAERLADGRG